jgi:hypothetical protein
MLQISSYHQASFGYAYRKDKPGTVWCVMHVSSTLYHALSQAPPRAFHIHQAHTRVSVCLPRCRPFLPSFARYSRIRRQFLLDANSPHNCCSSVDTHSHCEHAVSVCVRCLWVSRLYCMPRSRMCACIGHGSIRMKAAWLKTLLQMAWKSQRDSSPCATVTLKMELS